MSTAGYRALIALANLLVVCLIVLLGFKTFVGSEIPKNLIPPAEFDPTTFEITNDGQQVSSIDQHQIVWNQLDPSPPPPPPQAVAPTGPVVQRPQDLSNVYQLLTVNKKSFVVQKSGGSQEYYEVGDTIPGGYTVEDIAFSGEGANRVAVVTVKTGGGSSTIRLSREP